MPPAVKHVIGRRLDRLPRAALEVLTLAAVLGSDFSLDGAGGGRARPRAGRADRRPRGGRRGAASIVEDTEQVDRFSFAHALVRETLYERPIASRRVRLHRRVAEALEFSPLPVHPAELAHHYFQARAVGGADKAILYGLEAGIAAQTTHAYEAAVEHYERVLSILPLVGRDDAGARCDLLLALGAARWQASQPDPRSTFAQALEMARELGSPEPDGARGARRRRPLLRAGERPTSPTPSSSTRCSPISGPATARCACASWRASPRPSRSRGRRTALELADEAFGIARASPIRPCSPPP